MSSSQGKQPRNRRSSGGGRVASWLRNNWTEAETREVMEILVDEFISSDYTTAAYSKSHAPDARFQDLSFSRPSRELYNKVQNLRQRFFTPHSYLLRWASPDIDMRSMRRAEKCLTNPKTRESIHGIFASEIPEALLALAQAQTQAQKLKQNQSKKQAAHASNANEHIDDSDDMSSRSGRGAVFGNANIADANSVKSVNYYCDIFRCKAPALWQTSVDAYRLFLANQDLQNALPSTESAVELSDDDASLRRQRACQRDERGGQSASIAVFTSIPPAATALHSMLPGGIVINPQHLPSSSLQTPNSSLLTDFHSDFNSDLDDSSISSINERSQMQLIALVGHSWHKFLSLRSRWVSLGLNYSSKDDWMKQEAAFLSRHMLSLLDYSTDPDMDVPLTIVPLFISSFDASNIEMAIGRSQLVRTVRLSSLASDLLPCIKECVDHKEPYTMVSLCRLTDRATHTQMSLALLVSHGSNDQRFGMFPHNDTMLSRLIAGNENLWHEYTNNVAAPTAGLHAKQIPPTPSQLSDDRSNAAAFTYMQSNLRYSFFARRKGHFFEMIRDEDWVPTMAPSRLRGIWSPIGIGRAAFLTVMRQDTEKVLAGMVELFGLRQFCYGFFDGISAATVRATATPGYSRRISDDPNLNGLKRRNLSTSRLRKTRISAGAIQTSNTSGGVSGNGSPYSGSVHSVLPHNRPQGMGSATNLLMSANTSAPNLSAIPIPAGEAAAAAAAVAAAQLLGTPQMGIPSMDQQSGSSNANNYLSVDSARSLGHSFQQTLGSAQGINNGMTSHGNSSSNLAPYPPSSSAYIMPFLSPQAQQLHSFSSLDVSSMSLPNSPFFGVPLDNVPQQQNQQYMLHPNNANAPHDSSTSTQQLFPPLNDAAVFSSSAGAAAVAAVAAAASAPTSVNDSSRAGSALNGATLFSDVSLCGLTSIACTGTSAPPSMCEDGSGLAVSIYPSTNTVGSTLSGFQHMHPYNDASSSSGINGISLTGNAGGMGYNLSSNSLYTGAAGGIAGSTHSSTTNITGNNSITGGPITESPAFWDMNTDISNVHVAAAAAAAAAVAQAGATLSAGGVMSAPLGHISDMHSPGMQQPFYSPAAGLMGLTAENTAGSAALAAEAAAMDIVNRVSLDSPSFPFNTGIAATTAAQQAVAVYPQLGNAAACWDETTSQSLRTVLGSTDMLMQLAQPSPTPTHYNVSAQATPAFESCSVPLAQESLAKISTKQVEQFVRTPISASTSSSSVADCTNPLITGDLSVSSSMAAYFGTPGRTTSTSISSSQETKVAQMQQASLNATTSSVCTQSINGDHQMDCDIPATNC
ncbi:hypothetical protein GGI26_003147 [Coemansia sp. RSA 1358]|nr:hypothetical protein EDC05_002579 [Coemansia umbellata]KAJ2622548.1 hypothetical protein GGI26_003147 [Coemansia sp. RSA 1358]